MALLKASSNIKKQEEQKKRQELLVSDEAQQRLAEILSDSPKIVNLAGTEWAVKPLRFGTQHLIAKRMCDFVATEKADYGDVLKGIVAQIPAICEILTLMLLNDKFLIYQNGDTNAGFSKLYKKTYETILWSADKAEMSEIILDCMQLIDVSFFMEALGMLQIFRASVLEKKRTRIKSQEQQ